MIKKIVYPLGLVIITFLAILLSVQWKPGLFATNKSDKIKSIVTNEDIILYALGVLKENGEPDYQQSVIEPNKNYIVVNEDIVFMEPDSSGTRIPEVIHLKESMRLLLLENDRQHDTIATKETLKTLFQTPPDEKLPFTNSIACINNNSLLILEYSCENDTINPNNLINVHPFDLTDLEGIYNKDGEMLWLYKRKE